LCFQRFFHRYIERLEERDAWFGTVLEDQTPPNTVFTGYGAVRLPSYCDPETRFYRSGIMQAAAEERMALRQQILQLLQQQMQALDSPLGLTDERLSECYERQSRVQALREKLQALSSSEIGAGSAPLVTPLSAETAANV
jgi:penicillin V acylase-like amidase (Ntn superfamily)